MPGSATASEIGRPPAVAARGGAAPDEVVRILRFSGRRASFVSPASVWNGIRISEGLATAESGSGFRSRHDHRAGGQGLQDRALMLPEGWHPACASNCRRCTSVVAEGPGRGPQRRAAPAPLSGSIPAAPGIPGRGCWVFAQHAFDRSTERCRCVAITSHDQSLSARLQTCRRTTEASRRPPHAHPSATSFATALLRSGLRHSNRAGIARPFRRLYDDDFACAESWRCRSALTA